ncbi:MAG: PKD domain-containing protein, partial [Paludibacteraceae bacterium]|nr:PKD domain-containing protein [Paludibacteraceae bacterium]
MRRRIYILVLGLTLALAVRGQQMCFDFTDLNATFTRMEYGDWSDSKGKTSTNVGRRQKLIGNPTSHTVITAPGRDGNVSALRTIRPGASASVRLGDDDIKGTNIFNPQGYWESVEYTYTAAANDPPILLFSYAAVMQHSSLAWHSAKNQPKIQLEILDVNNNPLDKQCLSFEFVSDKNLGWQEEKKIGANILWKDWTTFGVDLSPYNGQTIKIKVTNYDCAEGSHYGYVYFDIQCIDGEIINESCGLNTDSVTLSAPEGFEYKWYKSGYSTVLSSKKDLTVTPDGEDYECTVSQVGRPNCYFKLTAKAESLFPVADFDINISGTCESTVDLYNRSYVAGDNGQAVSPLRMCDYYYWDLGDGNTSTQIDVNGYVYQYSGTYTIKLRSSIFDIACSDSISKTVDVIGKIRVTNAYICFGDQYEFHGQYYSQPGIYQIEDFDENGCWTTFELRLSTNEIRKSQLLSICPDDTVMYNGKVYSQPGIYYDSLTTEEGCVITRLDIGKYPKRASLYYQACYGETIRVNNREITQNCVFEDTLISYRGCDSIVRYTYSFNPSYMKSDSAEICQGSFYDFYGQQCRYEGIYRHTFKSVSGCDSVMVLRLKVRPAALALIRDTFCTNVGYLWQNRMIYEPGTYYDTIKTKYGCDSVLMLELSLPTGVNEVDICHGETFEFNGRSLSQTGVYYDTTITSQGCDSVTKLILNVRDEYHYYDTLEICDGESALYRGWRVSTPGTHIFNTTTVYGCDCIYEVFVIQRPRFHNIEYDTVCGNGVYMWHGKSLTESGIYYDSIKSSDGCDNVHELRLTVYHSTITEVAKTFCYGGSLTYGGKIYNEAGVYYDTLINIHGCDSVVRLVVNICYGYNESQTVSICQGDAYNFRGKTVRGAGVYRDTTKNDCGCDSIFELTVTVLPTYRTIEYDTAYQNQTYQWHNRTLTETGVYLDTVQTVDGCDSICKLHLLVMKSYLITDYEEICRGQSYTFDGKVITEEGVYYDSLQTVYGVDSVIKLVLNYKESYHEYKTDSFCHGGSYTYNGKTYTHAGTYHDTVRADNGCDNILTLTLIECANYYFLEEKHVCTNGVYLWHNQPITESGIYWDSLKSVGGCDSVYELRLTIDSIYMTEQYENICAGDIYTYRRGDGTDTVFTKSCIYYDTLKSRHGCDSVIKLIVNVLPTFDFHTTEHICRGDSYNFNGRQLRNAGTYYDSLRTESGCYSIYSVTLVVHDTFYSVETDTVCIKGNYHWHGRDIAESGVYFDSLHTAAGCDSIYELRLTINRAKVTELRKVICNGSSFWFNGQNLTKSGVYSDTLVAESGCDSIVRLYLNVLPEYDTIKTVKICQGDVYDFNGRMIGTGGWYADSLKTVGGCDSVIHLFVKVEGEFLEREFVTVCSNSPHIWRGRLLTESGVYYDSLVSSYGCDSVYELNLTISENHLTTLNETICNGGSYTFGNRVLTKSGVYYDTLRSVMGCDSVVKLILNVRPRHDTYETVHICAGESYTYKGRTIKGGVILDTMKNIWGCDSIHHLVVSVDSNFHYVKYDTVCGNEPYDWRGRVLYESGTYYDSFSSIWGCDSIYELRLELRPNHVTEINATICQGESYWYRGKDYSAQGVYYDTLMNRQGCDSVIKLYVNVLPKYDFYDTIHICQGSSVVYHGDTIRTGGSHIYKSQTAGGCESTYHLWVITDTAYHFIQDTTLTELPFLWHGLTITAAGTYYDSIRSSAGCDSIHELRVTLSKYEISDVVCEGEVYQFGKMRLTESGTYSDTLISASGADSVVVLHLNVLPRKETFDTVHVCMGGSVVFGGDTVRSGGQHTKVYSSASGCDSISHMFVIIDTVYHYIDYDTMCGNEPYTWHGQTITQSGVYYDRHSSARSCDSIYELRLTLYNTYVTELYADVCKGNTYSYKNRELTAGVHYDTLGSIHGCDSILKITVRELPTYSFHETVHICRGGSYNFGQRTITNSGTYYDSLKTSAGCDSIHSVTVIVEDTFHIVEEETVCGLGQGKSHRWHGRDITESGTYYDSLKTSAGCDSIHELRLTIIPEKDTVLREDICDGGSFWFNGRNLTKPGVYSDTLVAESGCDSIVKLILNVRPRYDTYDTVHICAGESYTYKGKTVNGGVILDTTKNVWGCDIVLHLVVSVDSNFHYVKYDTVCGNEPYDWRGRVLYESGTYYDSFSSIWGCDSIYELRLELRPNHVTEINATICQGESYWYRGKDYSAQGVYYDTLMNRQGCDSVIKLYVNVLPKYDFYDTIHICQGSSVVYHGDTIRTGGSHIYKSQTAGGCESTYHLWVITDTAYHFIQDTTLTELPFLWHGLTITAAGTYYDSIRSSAGCDSIHELRVTLSKYEISDVVCEGEVYQFGKMRLTESGTYSDTLISASGADSVVVLHLNVLPRKETFDTVHVCMGGSVVFGGDTVRSGGQHTKVYSSASGCDSISHMFVIIDTVYHYIDYDTVCGNKPYTWHGQTIMQSGVYYDRHNSTGGCDSIYELRLTLYNTYVTELYADVCQGNTYSYKNRELTAGVHYDTLGSIHGCDSILKITVRELPTYSFHETVHICRGGSYNFGQRTITNSGTYYDSLKTSAGCDSIHSVTVIVEDTFHIVEEETVCGLGQGKSHRWHGRDITESGTYYDSLKTSAGCDSIHELRLTIIPEKDTVLREDICDGGSFWFNGRNLTKPGVYSDTLVAESGCDSIVKLILNVRPRYDTYDTVHICAGESYTYKGKTVNGGVILDTTKNVWGCDIVLHLVVSVDSNFHYVKYDTVCGNEPYDWRGRVLYESGTYYDSFSSIWGCDSIYELRLELRPNHVTEINATICQGESYWYRGKDYSAQGVYYDTLMNRQGCDSVIKLYVNVLPKYDFYDTIHICQGSSVVYHGDTIRTGGSHIYKSQTAGGCESTYHLWVITDTAYHFIQDTTLTELPFLWHGLTITAAGTYYDSIRSSAGCDSIHELRVTLSKYEISDVVCEGEVYQFGKMRLTESGTYSDTLISASGADSVVVLHLNVLPRKETFDTVHVCMGGSVVFGGDTVRSGGQHTKVYSSASGCDSISHMFVIIDTVYHYIDYDTVCGNKPYTWHGQTIMQSGVYYDRHNSTGGCDSIYELRLELRPEYVTEISASICQGESYWYRGKNYSAQGDYYDTLLSSQGCDSVVKLYVNVLPKHDFYDTVHICHGSQYLFRNRYVSAGGWYADSLKTKAGCDSVYHLCLVIDSVYMQTERQTICSNEPYYWRGRYFGVSGTYYDTVRTKGGCDSIFGLRLNINPIPVTEIKEEICQGESYVFNGQNLSAQGTYEDTLMSVHGCDSVIRLYLNVLQNYDIYDTVHICQGSQYNFRGRIVQSAGAYSDSLRTEAGCDSIYHLLVIVDTVYHYLEYDTVCGNKPYTWHGQTIMQSGVYYDRHNSTGGCDSIYELRLELRPEYVTEISASICQGESYWYRGKNYSAQGDYYDTLLSSQGCDSVVKLYVNVLPKHDFYDTVHICHGSQYLFRNRYVSAGGWYADSLKTKAGCDSVYHLCLVIDSVYMQTERQTICSNEPYYWRGRYFGVSGTYYDTVRTKGGCDSIFGLRLNINPIPVTEIKEEICQGESYVFNGQNLSAQGTYEDTLMSVHGCDSVIRLYLNVLQNYDIYDTVHICQGSQYNFRGRIVQSAGAYSDSLRTEAGCDSIYHLLVIVDTVYHYLEYDTVCSNELYYWRGQTIMSGGIYYDRYNTVAGCDILYELHLEKHPTYLTEIHSNICQAESYVFNGQNLSVLGTYEDTLMSVHGCDSVIRLYLNVLQNYDIYDTVHICQGSQYNFRGRIVRSAGSFSDSLRSDAGCDSIYHLLVIVDTVYHYLEYDTVCSDQPYIWRGQTIMSNGTYYDRYNTVAGCDSIYELRLQYHNNYIT